jgi:hypothetical protein
MKFTRAVIKVIPLITVCFSPFIPMRRITPTKGRKIIIERISIPKMDIFFLLPFYHYFIIR